MFLHIGTKVEILIKNIICIMDLEKTNSKITNEFLYNSSEILKISYGPYKSMIVVSKNKKNFIYLTPISTITLKKRANGIKSVLNL